MERLLSAEEVAEFLGIPVATLYQWRHKGCGPDAYRVGRHLRYDPATVRAWLQEHLAVNRGVG
ncbi:MAG: excisionase [Nocardioides sp.]|nr:excisionase [Nocardioides sp.]|tara:strand:+ start:2289 stop:2477 length:189 start_codon:yes stop_codon:yes gene_type:complete